VAERVSFKCGNMFTALDPTSPKFDAIVSNPPYVSQQEMGRLEPELSFEPRAALTDEQDGHTYLSILFNQCREWLKPGGHLIVETGICGLPVTPSYLQKIGHYHDLAGIKRGAVYRL